MTDLTADGHYWSAILNDKSQVWVCLCEDERDCANASSNVDNDFNADFLQEFAREESWRFRERPQMTDEESEAFLDNAKNVSSVACHWSQGTRHNVWTLDKKWKAYVVGT